MSSRLLTLSLFIFACSAESIASDSTKPDESHSAGSSSSSTTGLDTSSSSSGSSSTSGADGPCKFCEEAGSICLDETSISDDMCFRLEYWICLKTTDQTCQILADLCKNVDPNCPEDQILESCLSMYRTCDFPSPPEVHEDSDSGEGSGGGTGGEYDPRPLPEPTTSGAGRD